MSTDCTDGFHELMVTTGTVDSPQPLPEYVRVPGRNGLNDPGFPADGPAWKYIRVFGPDGKEERDVVEASSREHYLVRRQRDYGGRLMRRRDDHGELVFVDERVEGPVRFEWGGKMRDGLPK